MPISSQESRLGPSESPDVFDGLAMPDTPGLASSVGEVSAAAGADGGALAASLQSFAHGTRTYLVVSTIFGLIVAVIDTLFLWLIDIPAPLLWGLLAFVTNYIPNIGFVIGLVPPALLALFEGGVTRMLIVIAVYSLVNFVIQSIIQPKYVGDAVGLSGTITMISLVFWGWVFGALGATGSSHHVLHLGERAQDVLDAVVEAIDLFERRLGW